MHDIRSPNLFSYFKHPIPEKDDLLLVDICPENPTKEERVFLINILQPLKKVRFIYKKNIVI